jgi:alpha-beta hydrolase superfamily lysophospholipase
MPQRNYVTSLEVHLRRLVFIAIVIIVALGFLSAASGFIGNAIGPGVLHPANLNPENLDEAEQAFKRTSLKKSDLTVCANDGVELRGWKVAPPSANGDWVLLFHGVSDNRSGDLGHAEFLLRHGYSVIMMDSRAHGKSGDDTATYGWRERYDTVAVTDALYATEKVRHLYAHGVSMGAAIALQSAAVEPRIAAVSAEDPFASLREVTYDYAGLDVSPCLGKTLLRPASIFAMRGVAKTGGFDPEEVSPEKAVAQRRFPVLLICGTNDHRILCRHAEQIYNAAIGPKELWIVQGAGHASALGQAPAEYENRVVSFFEKYPGDP